jgi:hypothetical protein
MFGDKDPCGYYSVLGVGHAATGDEIKKAFKAKSQQFHPDKNVAPDATKLFQFITKAFQILGDAGTRAQYDAQSYGSGTGGSPSADQKLESIACSICHKISAQPRYVIYRHVVSLVFMTRRGGRQGIFCSKCAAKQAYRASAQTWLLGWWGLPWGPIYSIRAIYSNMVGGEQPPLNNVRILSWQARYFASIGRLDFAKAVARDALRFAAKIAPSGEPEPGRPSSLCDLAPEQQDPEIVHAVNAMNALLADTGSAPTLRDRWGFRSTAFKVQFVGMMSVIIAAIAMLLGSASAKTAYKHVPPTGYNSYPPQQTANSTEPVNASPAPAETPNLSRNNAGTILKQNGEPTNRTYKQVPAAQTPIYQTPQEPRFNEPVLQLPATGEVRALWKQSADTVLAPLSVVTATGSPNYYVKVVDWQTHKLLLVLFVRSGETASVEIPVGSYELRYGAGEKWYGETVLFGQETTYAKADKRLEFRIDGEQAVGHTVELIKQLNGNLRETAIRAQDF